MSGPEDPQPLQPLRNVAKHFGLYSIGATLSLLCSLALLPVYTTQFSTSQFGLVATGQIIALLGGIAARLGIGIGMFRHLVRYHADGDRQAAVATVTTCLGASAFSGAVATGVMLVVLSAVGAKLGADEAAAGVLIAVNLAVSAPREIVEFTLRATGQVRVYLMMSCLFLVLSTLLTFILVVPLHQGVTGVFAAILWANGASGVIGLYVIRGYLSPKRFAVKELRHALRFGIPSIPALMSDWISQYSDRFFLSRFGGLAQVGIYSLGYRIGMIEQQVVGTATQSAWDPFVLSHYHKPNGARLIADVATAFAVAGMAVVVLISAIAPGMLAVAHAKSDYLQAVNVVFLIAIANFFAVMQYLFLVATSIRLRPEIGTLLRAATAATNTMLNIVLIPRFGAVGAAWSTVLTFLLGAVLTERIGQRLWAIPYEYRKLLFIVAGGWVSHSAVGVVYTGRGVASLLVAPAVAEVVFVAWLFLTGVMRRRDIGRLLASVHAVLMSIRTIAHRGAK